MRPDEHKKKKNTQYKKKHGVTDKSKEVKGQGQNTGKGHGVKQADTHKTKEIKKEVKHSESSESSDDGDVNPGSSKASFQRRTLVSNWDRYDIPQDEESTTTKGEDFAKLLQATGSSSSQFKFKEEEEEWASPEQADFSLDLQDLSSSIGCLPLYKVLRLNKDLFTVEQIKEYDRNSSENQNRYREKHGIASLSCPDNKDTDNQNRYQEKHGIASLSCPDNKDTDSVVSGKIETLTIPSDELDELLDSVVLQSWSEANAKNNSKIDKSEDKVISALEDDLDSLLSEDNQEVKRSPVKPETTKTNSNSAKNTQDDDLEDWLDSVLDS